MNNNEQAGQVVMHAHIHLIPRKSNDKIRLIADIKNLNLFKLSILLLL